MHRGGIVVGMPAPFAASLCGYRPKNDNPNTSDNSDKGSIELGHALFEELGVPPAQRVGEDPGNDLEEAVIDHLQPLRPDLVINRSRSAMEFEQYEHLAVFPHFRKKYKSAGEQLKRLHQIAETLPTSPQSSRLKSHLEKVMPSFGQQEELVRLLLSNMPEESFLKLDITCGAEQREAPPHLHLGLSAKWSLRTDRAQDCISQGSKLVSQRRGPMPHYAVVTMEPRPAMLKILAAGSGSIDYVYHLDLPALKRAVAKLRRNKPARWSPGLVFDKLIQQRRIRDYDDLVEAVQAIPTPSSRPLVPDVAMAKKEFEVLGASGADGRDGALFGFDLMNQSSEDVVRPSAKSPE